MQNISRIPQLHARRRPSAEALVFGELRLSWCELDERIQATAAGLADRAVGPDVIVALVMKNSTAFIEILYALSHLGAIVLPLNFRLATDEIAYIVEHAGAEYMIVDEEFETLTSSIEMPKTILDTAAQFNSTLAFPSSSGSVPVNRRESADIYRLMYTSGTTDRPKGVIHTYDNFYWKSLEHIAVLAPTQQDRLCVVGPLYHVGASDLPGLAVHAVGGTLVIMREFEPEALLGIMAVEKISGIWLAPAMTNQLLSAESFANFDLSSLQWCIGGGERTPESRIRQFSQLFPNAQYIDAYGMTETVSGDTFMEPGREIEKIGSVGRPTPFLELEIRDNQGVALAAGEEGEICMRGPKVTQGYWKDPERTAEAMWPDGFFRSGDVGYLDSENFLYLTDRKKDMIISGGENIASSEVERVIYEIPQVMEAAVVARTSEKWGETPIAIVVLRAGASLSFDELSDHCQHHLAKFKCPSELIIVDSLPRNPSGKVLKRILRDQIHTGALAS